MSSPFVKRKKKKRSKSDNLDPNKMSKMRRKKRDGTTSINSIGSFPKKDQSTISSTQTPNGKNKIVDIGEDLFSLNSHQKNPVLYPSSLKKYVKGRKVSLSPMQMAEVGSTFNQKKNVPSFGSRMMNGNFLENNLEKKKKKFTFDQIVGSDDSLENKPGILRWDDYSFRNKNENFKLEKKRVKKKVGFFENNCIYFYLN